MTNILLHTQAKPFTRPVPEIKPGYTVRVHERIQEGGKERVQIFEGLVISVHKGHIATDASFTVRRIVSGVGVEKVFALYAPSLEKIEVKKVAKVRRAKLFFIRGRSGKSARMTERFTNEGEFAVAIPEAEATVEEQRDAEPVVEAPVVEEEAPAAVEEAPAAVEEAPAAVEEAPVAAEEAPVTDAASEEKSA
jgi:large subunit ribosomal protein L19